MIFRRALMTTASIIVIVPGQLRLMQQRVIVRDVDVGLGHCQRCVLRLFGARVLLVRHHAVPIGGGFEDQPVRSGARRAVRRGGRVEIFERPKNARCPVAISYSTAPKLRYPPARPPAVPTSAPA